MTKDKGYVAMSAVEKNDVNFKRRVHTRFMSDQNLRSSEPRLLDNVREFLKLLKSGKSNGVKQGGGSWGPSTNVSEVCNWLTFDVITDFYYGAGVGMLKSPENLWLFRALYELKIDRLFLASAYRDITNVGTWAQERAEARVQNGQHPEQPDLFQGMIECKYPKTGLGYEMKELWTESMLLLVAGSDSTSTAMTATLFCLAHHPKIRRRVVEELNATFENAQDVGVGTKLDSCK